MANNRLYLVHLPTGKSICFAKRYGTDWGPKTGDKFGEFFQEFFDECYDGGLNFDVRDHFVLAIEDNDEAPWLPEIRDIFRRKEEKQRKEEFFRR